MLRKGARPQSDPAVVAAFLDSEAAGEIAPLRPLDAGLLDRVARRLSATTTRP